MSQEFIRELFCDFTFFHVYIDTFMVKKCYFVNLGLFKTFIFDLYFLIFPLKVKNPKKGSNAVFVSHFCTILFIFFNDAVTGMT